MTVGELRRDLTPSNDREPVKGSRGPLNSPAPAREGLSHTGFAAFREWQGKPWALFPALHPGQVLPPLLGRFPTRGKERDARPQPQLSCPLQSTLPLGNLSAPAHSFASPRYSTRSPDGYVSYWTDAKSLEPDKSLQLLQPLTAASSDSVEKKSRFTSSTPNELVTGGAPPLLGRAPGS